MEPQSNIPMAQAQIASIPSGRKRSMPCAVLPATSLPALIIPKSTTTDATRRTCVIAKSGVITSPNNLVQVGASGNRVNKDKLTIGKRSTAVQSKSSPPSSSPSRIAKRPKTQEVSPILCLRSIFGSAGSVNCAPKSFLKPTDADIEAYDLQVVRAIRTRDIDALKEMHKNGKNLNACNQFGESLIHMACRRGDHEMVTFMLQEAKVRTDIRDDFGRNPLHDACWTSEPSFELMDVLLDHADPFMLLSEDVRGSTPFDYVRRNHWTQWAHFLTSRKEKLRERILSVQKQSQTSK